MAGFSVRLRAEHPLLFEVQPRPTGCWEAKRHQETWDDAETVWVVATDTEMDVPKPIPDHVLPLCGYRRTEEIKSLAPCGDRVVPARQLLWDMSRVGLDSLWRAAGATRPQESIEPLELLQNRLKDCPLGKEGAAEFEDIVAEALDLALQPEFDDLQIVKQARSVAGIHRRDYVIVNDNPPANFWASLATQYGVQLLVVDAKNYTEPIRAPVLDDVRRYIGPSTPFGRAALVVSRWHRASTADDHCRQLIAQGTLLLHLTAEELFEMVSSALSGVRASKTLEEKRLSLELSVV